MAILKFFIFHQVTSKTIPHVVYTLCFTVSFNFFVNYDKEKSEMQNFELTLIKTFHVP